MMQSIVICSLPLEWFVAHNALGAMGSNRMRRFLIFLKELMQGAHYYAALTRIFIYLISFAEKCITRLLICQTSCTSIGKKMWKITFQQILVLASQKIVLKRTTMQKILLAKICWWQLALKRARLLL